jgi:glucose/mannose-6-phosphate isomerase
MGPNPSFDMADALHGMLPVIYSGVGLLEAVNLRWRTQIQENAKASAVGHLFPELDHNEIMSFEAAAREIAGCMAVVVLRDRDDHPQVQRRMDITREIVRPYVGAWYEVETEGESRLARMCSLIQLGDWVSFWLAMRQLVDPSPVGNIQQLKGMLVESEQS